MDDEENEEIDRVSNEKILNTIKENRILVGTIIKRKGNWIDIYLRERNANN